MMMSAVNHPDGALERKKHKLKKKGNTACSKASGIPQILIWWH